MGLFLRQAAITWKERFIARNVRDFSDDAEERNIDHDVFLSFERLSSKVFFPKFFPRFLNLEK